MTTYDPHATDYLDEKSVRDELTRAFDICGDCRLCVDHCSVFPMLFELLDAARGGGAGQLTPAEQDDLVDRCFHCDVCATGCPYTPERHELRLDLPKLMLRALAMRRNAGQIPARRRRTTEVLGRTNLLTSMPLGGVVSDARPGGLVRRINQWLTGIAAGRVLPARTDRSFRAWFERREQRAPGQGDRRVAVVPTCLVDRAAPHIGVDLVRVLEHNGVDCVLAGVQCCGAPWLQGGDLARFRKVAEANVRALSDHAADGCAVVVPQPTCADVLQRAHVDHVHPSLRSTAEEVARHTFDATAYLMELDRSTDGGLDAAFAGPVPESITHVVGGHQRVRGIGHVGADLLRLTGATVDIVEGDSADEVMWGLSGERAEISAAVAHRLAERVGRATGDIVTGESVLANTTIEEATGRRPIHPVEVIARSYGFDDDSTVTG